MTEWMCKKTPVWISLGGSLLEAHGVMGKIDVGEIRAHGGDKSTSSPTTSKNEVATPRLSTHHHARGTCGCSTRVKVLGMVRRMLFVRDVGSARSDDHVRQKI